MVAVRLHARRQRHTSPVMDVWPMALLQCAFTRGVYGLQHLEWLNGLRHSCDTPSREVSMAHSHSTIHVCMVYKIAAVRIHARCQRLTAPYMGVWSTAQLWCVFTRVFSGKQHLTRVYGLWNSYGAPPRELLTAYCTLH